jgi:hypothetical protein
MKISNILDPIHSGFMALPELNISDNVVAVIATDPDSNDLYEAGAAAGEAFAKNAPAIRGLSDPV